MAIFNEKEPYKFQEYPKSVNGKVVTSAAEEAALKAKSLPSAEDLDAVAEEQKAADATKSAYQDGYLQAMHNALQSLAGSDANNNPVASEAPTTAVDTTAVLTDGSGSDDAPVASE